MLSIKEETWFRSPWSAWKIRRNVVILKIKSKIWSIRMKSWRVNLVLKEFLLSLSSHSRIRSRISLTNRNSRRWQLKMGPHSAKTMQRKWARQPRIQVHLMTAAAVTLWKKIQINRKTVQTQVNWKKLKKKFLAQMRAVYKIRKPKRAPIKRDNFSRLIMEI